MGYEQNVGSPVFVKPSHLIITGLTNQSGKTEALKSFMVDDGKTSYLVFETKPGALDFSGHEVPAMFKETTDPLILKGLLESQAGFKLKFEYPWLIHVCKGANSLADVGRNISDALASEKLSPLTRNVYTTLDDILQRLNREISRHTFTDRLDLSVGVNVMRIGGFSEELQQLVIKSCADYILQHEGGQMMENVVLVLDEAWKVIPQRRGSAAKESIESYLRQGAFRNCWCWMGSQDITGVDKACLKHVGTWLLGRQTETNEVRRTLQQIPGVKPKVDTVMRLPLGWFVVVTEDFTKTVYVKPSWLPEDVAIKVAKGEIMSLSPEVQAYKPKQTALAMPTAEEDWSDVIVGIREVRAEL